MRIPSILRLLAILFLFGNNLAGAQSQEPPLAERARAERERRKAAAKKSSQTLENDDARKNLPGSDYPEMAARFELPKGWKLQDGYPSGSMSLTCPGLETYPASCNMWINSRALDGPITDNGKEEFAKARKSVENLTRYEPILEPWKSFELAGLPAMEVTVAKGVCEWSCRRRMIYVVAPELKRMYHFSVTGPDDRFEALNEAFEKFLASFKPIS